jgi:quinol monooxygenase YgiN
MKMISFTVRMRFDAKEVEEMRGHLEALARESRLEPGCVSYIPHFLADDPTTVMIYEQYVDDAALDAHRASPHFAQHAIGGLYQGMKDRHVENLVAVA